MLNKIKEEIKKANTIVITGHINPDGDCIGAAIALKYIITSYDKNKKVEVIIDSNLPKYVEKLEYFPVINKKVDYDIDLLISVDVANEDRLAVPKDLIKKAKRTINIDHHISNTKFFDLNYVEVVSSASEIIHKFVELFNVELTKEIASYIYLGIINDTGNFRHNNVSYNTFEIAAKIAKTGINLNKLSLAVFSKTRKKAEIFSKSISCGEYIEELGFSYYYITKEEIEKNSYSLDDMDGVSEYLNSLEDVRVALFLREEDKGQYKASMRSKDIDVNYIASQFNGGGHKLASGFRTDMKIEEVIKIIKDLLFSIKNGTIIR